MAQTKHMERGPLPIGWHRVTWRDGDRLRSAVTEDLVSAIIVKVAMESQIAASNVTLESWSDFDGNVRPEVTVK